MVSVWLVTYNHEPYIAKAIEGVLKQQTNFAVELVIGEDYSSDNTRAIVQEYKAKYPEQITLFLAEYNMGMIPVLRPTYALCRGKYVAMLDGDDYWTDPLKLQKQVDQLEQNPALRFSFHKVSVFNEHTGEYSESPDPVWSGKPGELYLEDFLRTGNPVYTLSVLYRNDLGPLPEWYYELPYPDLALYFLLLMHGGAAQYLPDNMGVYRIHGAGSFSSLTLQRRYFLGAQLYERIRRHLPPQYQDLLVHELQHIQYEVLLLSLKNLRISDAVRSLLGLGAYQAATKTHRPKRWPHDFLLTSIRYTAQLLHKIGLNATGNYL